MATRTLTPVHYYQVVDHVVTSKDPSRKTINGTAGMVVLEFDIPVALKHALVSKNLVNIGGSVSDFLEYSAFLLSNIESIEIESMIYTGSDNFYSGYYDDGNVEYDSHPIRLLKAGTSKLFVCLSGETYRHNVGSFGSANLKLTYTTGSFLKCSMSPKSSFINPAAAKSFTFSPDITKAVLTYYTLTGGTLYYKKTADSSYSALAMTFTGTPYTFTLPANTLAGGSEYSIYAQVEADDGTTADTAVGTFSTADGLPQVTPIAPKNSITEGTAIFEWSYYNVRGTSQSAYEIAYSANGGALQYPTGKVVTSDTTATLTIPEAGTIAWQIRAWNQDDVAGDWSEPVTFINRIPPDAPEIVQVNHAGMPTIFWNAANQIAYQVTVSQNGSLVYDSGQVYSADQNHQIRKFLPDGTYTISVRIINIFGMPSSWSETEYLQSFSGLPVPVFTATNNPDGVLITITRNAAFSTYYLQRDGKTIAEVTESSYLDRFAAGVVTYTMIGVNAAGAAAFASQTVNRIVTTTSIRTEDGQVIDCSRRWADRINPQKTISPEFGLFSYIGANRPAIISSKLRDIRFSFGFADHDRIAESLIGKDLFYSDVFGNAEWTQITAISRSDAWYGNETVLELTAILHDEEIEI
jgi:hypothetical protein